MSNNERFADFLSFKFFVTRTLIIIGYAIGAVLITISGIIMMLPRKVEVPFAGTITTTSALSILLGLCLILLGNIFWRVICESVIIRFSIQDDLKKIKKHLEEQVKQ